VFQEQPEAVTTILVARRSFVEERRDLARALVAAHVELTGWMGEHPEEARDLVQQEIQAITRQTLPEALLEACWPRIRFSADVDQGIFDRFVQEAQRVGFLTDVVPLTRFVERP
jgi:NitT/TauT family transport system substrate-binding protein